MGLPHAVLRPNLFLDEVTLGGFLGVCGELRDADVCSHPFAASAISAVDVRDVGACAAALLTAEVPSLSRRGEFYEINGPSAICLGEELAAAISEVRPRPVTIEAVDVDSFLAPRQLPAPAAASLAGFLRVLQERCAATSDTVLQLTGRHPRSVREFVHDHAAAFMPSTFRRLLGTPAASFRAAARVATLTVAAELQELAPDEVFIRVVVAGVNGGADTFTVTRAPPGAADIPLGKEGVGVVVASGPEAAAAGFAPGQRIAFIGVGYTEYARVPARLCHTVDASADPAELTALRVSGHTAAVALGYTEPVQPGDVVVVTACCGATGSFAVQIAKAAGATVIGTVGSAVKADVAKSLGVDRVVRYRDEDLAGVLRSEYPDGIDLAYEGVGGPLLGAICANLKPDGRVLVVGSISQYPHNANAPDHGVEGLGDVMDTVFRPGRTVDLPGGRGKLIGNVWGDSFAAGVLPAFRDRLYADHASGKLLSLVDRSKTFRGVGEAPEAVEHMLSGQTTGKVVVHVSEH